MNRRIRVGLFLAASFAAGVLAVLVYTGAIRFNRPSEAEYPVRGVDVSAYQEIDWGTIAAQGIDFAYVKATEGSAWVDPYFAANFEGAIEAGFRVGTYHFFSFDSAWRTQTEAFISAVPVRDATLPSAVDLELYGSCMSDPKPSDEVWPDLQDMIGAIKAAYGQEPILYVTGRTYDLYVSGRDVSCDRWIRSVYFSPHIENWSFWQYTDKGRLAGYAGIEKNIDLNVFNGSELDHLAY